MNITVKNSTAATAKSRNPRITVCYTLDEYQEILAQSRKAGLRKSQYVHDGSLGRPVYEAMTDLQAQALISLADARSELVHIHNALQHKSQDELRAFFHDPEFMDGWIEATTYLIRRWGEIQKHFTYLQSNGSRM